MIDALRCFPTCVRRPLGFRSPVLRTVLAGICLLLSVAGATAVAFSAPLRSTASTLRQRKLQVFRKRHDRLRQSFLRDLTAVARYCRENNLPAEAETALQQTKLLQQSVNRFGLLPEKTQPPLPRNLPPQQREGRLRLRKAREDYANSLYQLSRDVLFAGLPSYAYQLLREVTWYHPDHIGARRVLGYVRYKDRWVSPFTKRKLEKGEIWHEKYGWIPKSSLSNYEKGLQYYLPRGSSRGTWKPAAVVAELRRNFRNAWEVRTEHFLVRTNHSLETGVQVASVLEEFYAHFFATFAGFFNSREQMKKLFAGTAVANVRPPRPYLVHYYRTKEEYIQRLQSAIPQIAITNGLYLFTERISHFFHSPSGMKKSTLYHEATHQIFYESLKNTRLIAERENFWIVEGISCYMESFRAEKGTASLGNPNHPRFVAAKYRYQQDRFYIPLAQFTKMGRQEFQTHRDIRKIYSQASGLAKFFMEYDGGKYREALIEYLSQIYRGTSRRNRVPSLEELTGVRYEELDRQYGEFITRLPVRFRR